MLLKKRELSINITNSFKFAKFYDFPIKVYLLPTILFIYYPKEDFQLVNELELEICFLVFKLTISLYNKNKVKEFNFHKSSNEKYKNYEFIKLAKDEDVYANYIIENKNYAEIEYEKTCKMVSKKPWERYNIWINGTDDYYIVHWFWTRRAMNKMLDTLQEFHKNNGISIEWLKNNKFVEYGWK